jgi:hypothetical protein
MLSVGVRFDNHVFKGVGLPLTYQMPPVMEALTFILSIWFQRWIPPCAVTASSNRSFICFPSIQLFMPREISSRALGYIAFLSRATLFGGSSGAYPLYETKIRVKRNSPRHR